ncbi:SAF domain-containing protein [Microbacterium sp. SORGH_AS_0888]|uniref:SAF domain-containing protein n=1 Tax=Microbacterium sp. SORGH_AS_0888 TaxID=3041791 RepID=UPI0027D78213|nr:SAF domain-containing protein [Microbacterium sp. SORGH_AS_0888]
MSSSAPRPRPRSVRIDPRFVVGILLVVASVTGVWFVVAAARQTSPVLVAARTLVPGETIASGDLRVAEVALGQAAERYAKPGASAADAVVVRTVSAGELVPLEALGSAEAARTTTVVVPSSMRVPAAVAPGAPVEVWAAPRTAEGDHGIPRVLVADAVVSRVVASEALGSATADSVELVVPRAALAELLGALSDESMLSVVPAGGGAR